MGKKIDQNMILKVYKTILIKGIFGILVFLYFD